MDTPPPLATGEKLVSDYLSVCAGLATAEIARHEAEQSESELMHQLDMLSSGSLLQPGLISTDWQQGLTRESIDAHIKKAQAAQIVNASQSQLIELAGQDAQLYRGKRVRIEPLDTKARPFDAIWHDASGMRTSPYNRMQVVGTIDELLFEKNAILVKPSISSRMLIRDLKAYVVYVIHPATMQPMVKITIL